MTTGPLHHWLLDKLSRDLAEEYQRIQSELRGQPQNIQLSGHLAENVWARLVADWLPPQYKFGFRRYLLYERPVDGESRSPEVDLVIFHPSYPHRLREQKEVLISGVVAAFSVKLSLTPSGLQEAIEAAAQLRRGIAPRHRGPIGDLVSPLIAGVLAQSHRDLGSDPQRGVTDRLMEASRLYDGSGATGLGEADLLLNAGIRRHPRNALDLVCVADLNCWHRHPSVLWKGPGEITKEEDKYVDFWNWQEPAEEPGVRTAEPIAAFVGELWRKLANRDPAMAVVGDGFQFTETAGQGTGLGQLHSLRAVADGLVRPLLRTIDPNRGQRANNPAWQID